MKGVFGVAKYCKSTLYFMYDSAMASDKVKRLCEEFPEVKLIGIREEAERPIIYFDLKYPLKIKDNILLYFEQNSITTL